MPTTTDLIGLAIDKNPVEFASAFDEIVKEKAAAALQAHKVELANSVYGSPETAESDDDDDFDFDEDDFDDDDVEDSDDDLDLDLDDLDLDDLDLDLDLGDTDDNEDA